VVAYLLCRRITGSRAGKVLVAIRDSETRRALLRLLAARYKLFVFVVSAVLAGVAGALYAPQVGIITPAKIACCRRSRWWCGWPPAGAAPVGAWPGRWA